MPAPKEGMVELRNSGHEPLHSGCPLVRDSRQFLDERLDDLRIPLPPGAPGQRAQSVGNRHAATVRTVAYQRVEGVADRDDACEAGGLRAGKPVGIARSVEALMVAADDRQQVDSRTGGGNG